MPKFERPLLKYLGFVRSTNFSLFEALILTR